MDKKRWKKKKKKKNRGGLHAGQRDKGKDWKSAKEVTRCLLGQLFTGFPRGTGRGEFSGSEGVAEI